MTPIKKTLISSAAALALLSGAAVAQTATEADPLKSQVEEGTAAAGEAIENTGQAAENTAEAAGETMESGADAMGDAATDTAQSLDPDAAATADSEAQMQAQVEPATVGELIGVNVASSAGEDIGEIDDVVRINGEVMAVVGVGGFLGLGEHSVALPLTELDWQGETVTAFGYTEEQLKSMDEYDSELATQLEADEQISLGKS